MTSFFNKGQVTKLKCTVNERFPETNALLFDSDLGTLYYLTKVHTMDSQLS